VATDILEHMNESRVVLLVAPEAQRLTELIGELAQLPAIVDDDAARIDVIAGLERVKAAAAAAQLGLVERFAVSQQAANQALGFEERAARRGIPEQVGLARRVSPSAASRQVTVAKALVRELPATLGQLQRGEISEFVATVVVNETSVLAAGDRRVADTRIAPRLPGLGPKRAQALARRAVIEIDQQAVVARAAKARKDRRVGCRPAPDTMAVLSALLPCEDGVRAYASLRAHADRLKATGDSRSRDQIMADTLVERLTGQAPATGGPVDIGLIMTSGALFDEPGGDEQGADLDGYGPIPAPLARDIIRRATAHPGGDVDRMPDDTAGGGRGQARQRAAAQAFIRRLYTDPATGMVTQIDASRRRFTGTLAAYLRYRDRFCRTPYCEAPIRHLDHISPHVAHGPTTADNGRGLCERCNYINQLPGWTAKLIDPDRHIVETTTPTGHTYRSHPPPAPGHQTSDHRAGPHSRAPAA
jgi:hypothetical protein